MALRNGVEVSCGRPNPYRDGMTCEKLAGEHRIHRDADGAEWVELAPADDKTPEGGAG